MLHRRVTRDHPSDRDAAAGVKMQYLATVSPNPLTTDPRPSFLLPALAWLDHLGAALLARADNLSLPHPRKTWRRRHERGLQGRRHPTRPLRRPEIPPRRLGPGPASPRAFPPPRDRKSTRLN